MRQSGILLHMTSLPSPHGVGAMGREARRFIDFLAEAGQSYWQLLPICPTGYGDSPYQSFSALAGNPYLIDLDELVRDGLLTPAELRGIDWGCDPARVDYGLLYQNRLPVLKQAVRRLLKSPPADLRRFKQTNADWLRPYALFMALKETHGGAPWTAWERDFRFREPAAMRRAEWDLAEQTSFWSAVQYLFFRQWNALRAYAAQKGVRLIGDLPIYAALDSAEVWADPAEFQLDGDRLPREVAGVPPDGFTDGGQLWGNPLYDWDAMEKDGFRWWIRRLSVLLSRFDRLRIDHFRGFDSYYAVPAGDADAKRGRWRKGPGIRLFRAAEKALGPLPVIAEDLGYLTDSVRALLRGTGYPGMKVLQFAFDSRENSDYLPHNYEKHCVVYPGTHDNDTIMGWMRSAPPADVAFAKAYLRLNEREGLNWGVLRSVWASVADLAIVPMQDILGLSSEARMNTPSTLGGNWVWRLCAGQFDGTLAARLRRETALYRRLPLLEDKEDTQMNERTKAVKAAMNFALKTDYHKTLATATPAELHTALSRALVGVITDDWQKSREQHLNARHALYFSAEFLVGRAIFNNLLCLGLTKEVDEMMRAEGVSLADLEQVEDAALGNGGLGRLAACYLDSAATLELPLDGYGIRYRYGLFKQQIDNGFQKEVPDDWTKYGDPWSIRREDETVLIEYGCRTVRAVPYDMPVLGYGTDHIGTLRLWQAEPVEPFDFVRFNNQDYDGSVAEKNRAEDISRVLYPNDSGDEGKVLRLEQEYFFSSASLQDMLRQYKKRHGNDFSQFAALHAVQLNDTHPVLAIPELVRLLMQEGLDFEAAFAITRGVFSYTNHTVMPEALETWPRHLLERAVPGLYPIIEKIDGKLRQELSEKGVPGDVVGRLSITRDNCAHMADLAVFAGRYVNGVARLHTEILKNRVLRDWYSVYPERFQNKTNGVTQRRWLALCNPELAALLTRLLGSDRWLTDLSALTELTRYENDEAVMREFLAIKRTRRGEFADWLQKTHGITVDPTRLFDVQIKRIHEYKRQFLNILAVLELYYEIKEGQLNDFKPTTYFFAGKSAPGYRRAKAIIKLIGEVARVIENDPQVRQKLRVVFVPNYNVSCAEYMVAAADVSEQISTAGTEASGTGNMKLMANGSVTLGTLDGANVEIVEEAGESNNYIFGAHVEEINDRANDYNPHGIYESDGRVHRVMDALVNGTLNDGGSGDFRELYDSILHGADWQRPDQYYLMLDFGRYLDAKKQVNRDAQDELAFAKKGWHNICMCGKFSSDRAIAEYARDIWQIEKVK